MANKATSTETSAPSEEPKKATFFGSDLDSVKSPSEEVMIKVDHVSMIFNIASESLNNLKEYAIALVRGELHFKEFRALNDISLEVKKGDVFGILGTNGSGKSTLLKIVAGVLDPSKGSCKINGNIAPLIELGAGFDMELTARENIYLNGALLGYSKDFINQHFDEIVDFAEVEQFLDMPLKNYSSGMVARIAFAIATVIIPDILIVDEVLSVGDFMFQEKCENRINSLIKDHGVTVLIVSHDNYLIERLCNKAIWIEKGDTRIAGEAKKVCQTYRMLGGHKGSAESEQRIFDLITKPTPKMKKLVKSVFGLNTFGSAVELNEIAHRAGAQFDNAVLIPINNLPLNCFANSLASLTNSAIYPIKSEEAPDIIKTALSTQNPKKVYILDSDSIFSGTLESIKRAVPDAEIKCYNGSSSGALSLSELSLNALTDIYNESDGAWGDTAIITHKDGIYDVLSIAPYLWNNKAPLIFKDEHTQQSSIEKLLEKYGTKQLVVLGGEDIFPEGFIKDIEAKGISTVRFCGSSYHDANKQINMWLQAQSGEQPKSLSFIHVWKPEDAYGISAFTASTNSFVILFDPSDMDSCSNALQLVMDYKESAKKLYFVGSETSFAREDKELFAKALVN